MEPPGPPFWKRPGRWAGGLCQCRRICWRASRMSASIEITYADHLRFTARLAASGHTVITDAGVAIGGLGESFSPTDLVAVALGTCILTTVAAVAQRHQVDLTGLSAQVEKEMVTAPVHRIGRIEVTLTMPRGLRDRRSTARDWRTPPGGVR